MFRRTILDILFPKHCLGCGREGNYYCFDCQQKSFREWNGQLDIKGEQYFDAVVCVGDYEDEILGGLIKACKYRFVQEIAPELGIVLAQKIKVRQLKDFAVVPVPLSKRRERWRGFNQAVEIGQTVSRELGLECHQCLKRVKHKKAQAKLSEEERQRNMNDCFEIIGIIPQRIILIDDVITTGSTLNECARMLRLAGAKEIIAAVLAKG